ncbi:hypothetical protein HGRIS_010295 [Hohenbuehelia grisea]|uniref:Protein kinase domain-containing protein n=1 Tax=Hohenbuehelia grisea TaxID=104357 RepID=A0ABR3J4H7_9AGAR
MNWLRRLEEQPEEDLRSVLEGLPLQSIISLKNAPARTQEHRPPAPERSPTLSDLSGQVKRQGQYPAAHGGFADIWICDWSIVGGTGSKKVAVKVLRCPNDHEEERDKLNKRLRRELRVWAHLKHPQILPLFGVVSDFGPYLSMVCPWKENGNLNRYLDGPGRDISLSDRFRILYQVSIGLAYLHSFSVVHGDLTGCNVLVDEAGDACLSDFGLSTVMLDIQGSSSYTSSIGGNVRFAAPENYRLDETSDDYLPTITRYSDIYSFGSIMLQTLSGRVPYYYMRSDAQVLIELVKGTWPRRPLESPYVSDLHWQFMKRCWGSDPLSRPIIREIIAYCAKEMTPVPEHEHNDDTMNSLSTYGVFRPDAVVNLSRDGLVETWVGTWDKQPPEKVVIKIIHIRMDRLQKDAVITGLRQYGDIAHPNLLPYLAIAPDIGFYVGTVCSWVDGSVNLNRYLRQHVNRGIDVKEKHRLLLEAGEALAFLHSKRLVHGAFSGVSCSCLFIGPFLNQLSIYIHKWTVLVTKDKCVSLCNTGILPVMLSTFNATPDISVYSEDIRWTDPGIWGIARGLPHFTPSTDVYAFAGVMLQVWHLFVCLSRLCLQSLNPFRSRRCSPTTSHIQVFGWKTFR